jgi:hypothetical protein
MSATDISNACKRKHLLRHRARLAEQWDELFPQHDFGTLQYDVEDPVNTGDPVRAHWRKVAQDAWNGPGWDEAARQYHEDRAGRPAVVNIEPERLARPRELRDSNISLDGVWRELNDHCSRPTPQVVIEAIWLSIRERGLRAVDEPFNQTRLKSCDPDARAELARRIETLRPGEVAS